MNTLEDSYTETYSHPTKREYKTGSAHKTKDWDAFALPWLPFKINKYDIFWVCVYSCLSYRHANHIFFRGFILSSAASLAVTYCSTLYDKRHDFRKKKLWIIKMCVSIFSATFVWNISHYKKNAARYQCIYMGLPVMCLLFLQDFNETWIFVNRSSKNTRISKSMKILPVGAELFHADRTKWRKKSLFTIFRRRLKVISVWGQGFFRP
jgi:hypothetical protein